MNLAILLLCIAISVAWLPAIRLRGQLLPPWLMVFIASVAVGLSIGVLTPVALLSLLLLCMLAWFAASSRRGASVATAAAALLAFALATHHLPGYQNALLFNAVRLSPDAAPFTSYLNFDKGAAGLIILAAFVPLITARGALPGYFLPTALAVTVTAVVTLGTGVAIGYIAFDPKAPAQALTFLVGNLFLTCIPEEAFFRGLIQERLHRLLAGKAHTVAIWVPVLVSASLFALSHAAGGLTFGLLAFLVGLGCAAVYARTRSIESSILTHFGVNALHFIAFTYPSLALAR